MLTIDEDYFRLKGGLERWLYRVVRKHAGHQEAGWQFTMAQLYDKSGSFARFSNFALDIRKIVKRDNLPGYALGLHRNQEGHEVVSFISRRAAGDGRSAVPACSISPEARWPGLRSQTALNCPKPGSSARLRGC